jgi:integrase
MASIFKKDKRKGAPWYIDYFDETGRRRRVKGCADKTATEQIARKLESDVELRRRGVLSARDEAIRDNSARPLTEHLADWHGYLLAKGGTVKHADSMHEWARRVIALVKGATLAEIDPPRKSTVAERRRYAARLAERVRGARLTDLTRDRVQAALATLRDAGRSLATCNAHRTAIRGFSRWAWRDGRTPEDTLAGVTGYNVAEDRRHDRRTLGVDELLRLVSAAESGPAYQAMSGAARALCYRLAVATGLRFSEIKSITPGSFDLSAARPTVTVAAGYTKNGEPATLPLPPDLAADLASYLAAIPEGSPAFPLPEKGAKMLRLDLSAAGIPYRDASARVFDFHSLRCQCATLADAAGVSPRVVQRLMRHSTLELTGRYTRPRSVDIEAAAASLPSLRPSARPCESLAATGTDPAPGATAGATATEDDEPNPFASTMVASSGHRTLNQRVEGSSPSGGIDDSCRHQPSTSDCTCISGELVSRGPTRTSRQDPTHTAPIRLLTATASATVPPDLAAVMAAWPELPEAVRTGIVAMVRAAAPAPTRRTRKGGRR